MKICSFCGKKVTKKNGEVRKWEGYYVDKDGIRCSKCLMKYIEEIKEEMKEDTKRRIAEHLEEIGMSEVFRRSINESEVQLKDFSQ